MAGIETLSNCKEIKIGIAEWAVARAPDKIITLGLGSCVGLTLFDPILKIGGMVHIMLPDSTQFQTADNKAKYADTAVQLLLDQITKCGSEPKKLQAKLAGGAQMFNFKGRTNILQIGARNSAMVKSILSDLHIKILSERIGGSIGRTMIFDLGSGDVIIKTIGSNLETI